MTKNSRISRGEKGNTEPSPKKQVSASKKYCFTHNFEIIENKKVEEALINKLVGTLKLISNFYIFSLEIGTENKRRHLQGYIEFKDPVRITGIKNVVENTTNWRKADGSRQQNITYISKDPIKGPYTYDVKNVPKYTAEQLRIQPADKLYKWQVKALEMARGDIDDRCIFWFWSAKPKVGKTQTLKHLMYYDNFDFVDGDKSNIMCAIVGDDGLKPLKRGYVFNFSNDKDLSKVSYTAMENMKDGLIFSGKYKSGGMLIPPLQVIVMANGPPVCKESDRWKVFEIVDDDLAVGAQDPTGPSPLDAGVEIDLIDSKFSINFY